MPDNPKVPLSWAMDQAGTLAQLWLKDNAPKPCTTEEFVDLFMSATFSILCRMTGKTPDELMEAMTLDMDMIVNKITD